MHKISLNVITYNEEKCIQKMFEEYRYHEVFNQVVIIDQQSTDRTVEIANDYGADVYVDEHHGYCEPSRILCEALSTNRYILILDADEKIYIQNDLVTAMRRKDYDGFYIQRMNHVNGKMISKYGIEDKYRIFKHGHCKFSNKLHTNLHPQEHSKVGRLKNTFIYHDSDHKRRKMNRSRYHRLINDGVPVSEHYMRKRYGKE